MIATGTFCPQKSGLMGVHSNSNFAMSTAISSWKTFVAYLTPLLPDPDPDPEYHTPS